MHHEKTVILMHQNNGRGIMHQNTTARNLNQKELKKHLA